MLGKNRVWSPRAVTWCFLDEWQSVLHELSKHKRLLEELQVCVNVAALQQIDMKLMVNHRVTTYPCSIANPCERHRATQVIEGILQKTTTQVLTDNMDMMPLLGMLEQCCLIGSCANFLISHILVLLTVFYWPGRMYCFVKQEKKHFVSWVGKSFTGSSNGCSPQISIWPNMQDKRELSASYFYSLTV